MNPTGKSNWDAPKTLCWDCANATHSEKCPWVDSFTPVPGWKARPTKIFGSYPLESYVVIECPWFRRDSFGAGTEKCLISWSRPIKLYDDDLKNISEAIIENAVEDWKALQFGALEAVTSRASRITKQKTLEFFFSVDFENFLSTFSERTPEQIRSWLHITEDMRPKEIKVLMP